MMGSVCRRCSSRSVVLLVLVAVLGVACGELVPAPPSPDDPTEEPSAPDAPDDAVPSRPALLVADATGIRIVQDGEVVALVHDGPATLAVPDLRGGAVFQDLVHRPTGLHHDADLGRNVYEWQEGGPDPIWHAASPGREPAVLIGHPDGALRLVDVVLVDEHPQVLYRLFLGGPATEPTAEMVLQEWLILHDLATGDARTLGLIGSFESSSTQLRIGGDLVAATFDPYGDPASTGVGMLPLAALRTLVDQDWLPTLVTGHLDHGPATVCGFDDPCEGWALATAASDGSRLCWVQGGRTWDDGVVTPWPVEVHAVDASSSTETLRVTVGPERPVVGDPVERATFIDDDGTFIVVSGIGSSHTVLLVTPDGEVDDLGLDGAVASLWEHAY